LITYQEIGYTRSASVENQFARIDDKTREILAYHFKLASVNTLRDKK